MNNFIVRFYQDSKLLGFESEAAGHPVYADADFIEITIPGDMNNNIVREVSEKDKAQYASLYAAYKTGQVPAVDGIPLEAWPRLSKAMVLNYKARNITTVEQVADMSDTIALKVGMGNSAMTDRTAAKAYLSLAKDSALAQKQALELERRDSEVADLKRQVQELAALAQKDHEPRRGRPPKE